MLKLLICTPFPNCCDDAQEKLLTRLNEKLLMLSQKCDLRWFICSNSVKVFYGIKHDSTIILDDPTRDNLVLKRRHLINEAIRSANSDDFAWDLLCWMDADDFPVIDNYLEALNKFTTISAYLGCLHGGLESNSSFTSYNNYQRWSRTNACESLTRGENPFTSGSCLVWKNNTPKEFLLGENVESQFSGVEDVCWAYYAKENAVKVGVQNAVIVTPSHTYGTSDQYTITHRRNLIREFYKSNGYKAHSQIGYSNNC